MSTETTRELIKEKFNPFTKLPWIDFNKGDAQVGSNVAGFGLGESTMDSLGVGQVE